MFIVFDTTGFAIMSLFACVIHEFGHLIVMALKGYKPTAIVLRGGGIKIGGCENSNSFAIIVAGSVANLIVFIVLYFMISVPYTNLYPIMFAVINLSIGLFNLLPLGCLDGKRLLQLFLTVRAVKVIEIITLIVVIVAIIFALKHGNVNFTLIATMFYVITVDAFDRRRSIV